MAYPRSCAMRQQQRLARHAKAAEAAIFELIELTKMEPHDWQEQIHLIQTARMSLDLCFDLAKYAQTEVNENV